MTHWLTIAFIAGALTHLAVQFWLSLRQSGHVAAHRDRVPAAFAGTVSAEEHAKAADYTVARQRFGRFEILFDTVLLFVMTLGGGIAALGQLATQLADGPSVLTGTIHVLLVLLAVSTASLPFSIWRTFVLENRFGFNRTTPRFSSPICSSQLLWGQCWAGRSLRWCCGQ